MQRVTAAEVTVDGAVVGAIGGEGEEPGLLVLLGVTHDDTEETARRTAAKVHGLRVLRDERSVSETGGAVLAVSQFTLYGDARKGRRPTWTAAAPGPVAEPLYDAFCEALRALGTRVETGRFGADMRVTSTNDGPTTLILDF